MDYKLLVLGDDTAAYGTRVKRSELHTIYGVVRLNTWYIVSEEDNPLFKNCDCFGGQGALIIFDMFDPLAFKNVEKLYGDLCVVCPGMHVYLCGTYNEEFLRFESWNKTLSKFDSFVRHNHLDIDAFPFRQKDYTMVRPFFVLVRKLTGFQDLMVDTVFEHDDVDDDHQDDGSSDEAESSEDDDIGFKGKQLRVRRAQQRKRRQQRKRVHHRH